jgi:peptidyl-tRNA hydrolase
VNDDPLRMYLAIRRGAFDELAPAGELAGAAAVRCVREFAGDPALEAWLARPGKVVLRARGGQWDELLATEPHVLQGDPDGQAVVALKPRRRSERGPLLERMQAMTSALEPLPDRADPDPARVTYLVNPRLEMSSGKTLAQIGHAAVMAADGGGLEDWVAAGCPATVIAPAHQRVFDALCASDALAARVVDGGLTEVAPGTVTVLALAPGVAVGR